MKMLGRYVIQETLGEGAMAHVFRGHDPSIDRAIAIKILRPELRANPDLVRRFLTESRAAGILSHAHIVTIYDVGEAEGIPYIAMEHIDGEPLDKLLETQGRVTVERVIQFGIQIADALDFAHRHGVVHRDIKPSNVLICDNGRTAKLLDFGIARVETGERSQADREACQTMAGQVMGTPRYMSPEQALGLPVDARTDQFSLGSVLYEMLTGKPAFPGVGLATLALQIAQSEVSVLGTDIPNCPRGLRFIIAKLLAKRPADRFADAAVLRKALQRECEAQLHDGDRPRRGLPLRFKLPLIMAATSAIALAPGAMIVIDRQRTALEEMASASAASTTDFVARNAAVRMVDNAGLPPKGQDWAPLQAFVESAVRSGNVRSLAIDDDQGVVRAAGDSRLVGKRALLSAPSSASATDPVGFRITRPIRYAGRDFGLVEMTVGRDAVDGALANMDLMLVALSLLVTAAAAIVGYVCARIISSPLRRLRHAHDEASSGNLAFRLSHRRTDEVGQLFDSFNHLVDALEAKTTDSGSQGIDPLQTRISTAAAIVPIARRAA